MGSFLYKVFIKSIRKFFAGTFAQIADINKKYAIPQLKSTRGTRFALLMLQIYLILLLIVLFYKFFSLLK